MGKIIDISGQRFGRLLVLKYVDTVDKASRWECLCDCGNITIVRRGSLMHGIQSCGCFQRERAKQLSIDLKDQRYGRLVVLHRGENRGVETTWVCRCDCGNIHTVRTKQLRSGHVRSCGCMAIETNKNRPKGERCRLWKGGITPKNLLERSSVNFRRWRKKIFERDNYTCQRCNTSGVYLHAHHILGFAEHELLRYEVDNGITLCRPCHLEFHKIYGFTKFSRDDTDDFLKRNFKVVGA